MGGAFGFYEGLRSSPSPALKIRLNTVLNSMTRRGPFIGNSAGVMGKESPALFISLCSLAISTLKLQIFSLT